MPQIDFGQAFAIVEENGASKLQNLQPVRADSPDTRGVEINPSKSRRAHLRRSDWVDIVFAIIAILGGLLCAFYIYDGGEFLRSTAAWPRHFFDARPSMPKSEISPSHVARSLDAPLPRASLPANDPSGDPFSRIPPSLSLTGSNSRWGRDTWPLSQLDLSAPGGDELMQAFTRGITDLGRVARLEARRKVGPVQSEKSSATQ